MMKIIITVTFTIISRKGFRLVCNKIIFLCVSHSLMLSIITPFHIKIKPLELYSHVECSFFFFSCITHFRSAVTCNIFSKDTRTDGRTDGRKASTIMIDSFFFIIFFLFRLSFLLKLSFFLMFLFSFTLFFLHFLVFSFRFPFYI